MSTPEIEYGKDLPTSLEKLEKRVAKLYQLQAEFLTEIKEVALEIDYLKKSLTHKVNDKVNLLRDIPQLVWDRILSLYQVEENDLWSLCLASADIDKRFNRDSPGLKESWILKKVMAVLVRNDYINKVDLLRSLNSGSQGLEDAAAQGWRYLKNTVEGKIVEFKNSRAISRFMEHVRRQRNVWTVFIGKRFKFDFDTRNLPTFNEREKYVRTVTEFLQKYGKFIFCIEMKYIPRSDEQERIGFLKRLLLILPNIQHFQQRHNYLNPILSTSFDPINKRNVTSLFKVEGGIGDHAFYKIFGSQCHTWCLDFWDFAQFQFVCPRTEMYCKNVKVLELAAHRFTLAHYETFRQTDFTSFVSLKQLILHGEDHLRTLKLVEKFPQVREVTLCCSLRGGSVELFEPPSCILPSVKKLTLEFYYIAPPPLDEIMNVLPSLRHFCLRADVSAMEFQNCLKKWKNRGTFENDIIDTYDLYAEEEFLSGSNIWEHMENLKTFVVESISEILEWESYPGKGMKRGGYTKRNEIYSRNEGSVTWKLETVLHDEWRFHG